MIFDATRLRSAVSNALIAAANPELIVLFGSQVTGSVNSQSDVDLLVVQPKDRWQAGTRRAEISRLRQALPRTGYPVDLLLFTPAEVSRWRGSPNHVISDALVYGEVLYERP